MQTIFVSPDFPLNRRMRKALQRGKLQVVREGGERSALGGEGGREWVDKLCGDLSQLADLEKIDALKRVIEKSIGGDAKIALVRTLAESTGEVVVNSAEDGGETGEDSRNPFTVDGKTALELFDSKARYWVPVYQRVYRWDKEQWNDFWEDVTTRDEFQYVGNIVLRRDANNPNRFETIDGQQRLTTIALLAIAVIRVLAGRGVAKTESPIKDLAEIFLAEGGVADNYMSDSMKIAPHSDNLGFLAELMKIHPPFNGGSFPPPHIVGNSSKIQMKKAVEFFVDKVAENYESLEEIRSFMFEQMGKVVFSRVVAGHEINPNPIFAALNVRGVPLTVPELVKNHFLSTLAKHGEDAKFDEKWKKLIPRIGGEKNPTMKSGEKELPIFLRSVFIGKYGYVRKSRLFQEIVEKIRNYGDVHEFLSQMDARADFYRAVVAPTLSGYGWPGKHDEERAKTLLSLPGGKVSIAFILAAQEKLSAEDFSEALRYCYAIGVRTKICGRQGDSKLLDISYNFAAHGICQETLDSPEKAAKARLAPLYRQSAVFKDNLSTFAFAGKAPALLGVANQKFLEHFFMVLEMHLGNNQFNPDDLRPLKTGRGGGQMRLGNWLLLESSTGENESQYETTRQVVGLGRAARQEKLAEWALEVPDWRIDCLEEEVSAME